MWRVGIHSGWRSSGFVALRLVLGAVLCASVFLPSSARAESSLPQTISARSISGQFIINDERSPVPFLKDGEFGTNGFFVRLEPAGLTVACERLKQILSRELGDTGPWRGNIYLILHSAVTTDDTIT